jgi:uncharacterized repeat protein (TIGR01451 family)
MRQALKLIALGWLGLLSSQSVWAVGTTAGSDITNTATADYFVGVTPLTATSNTTTTTVDELLNVTVIGQDAGSQVTVIPGDTNQVLTYLITNTGNGTDSYSLTATNLVGDDFDAVPIAIYLDDGDGVFNAADTLLDGSNDPVMNANDVITVFVVADIPAGLFDGDIANIDLKVDSNTATGVPGTVVAGGGDGGTDAVVGTSGGSVSATESYVVSNVVVSLLKSASILDSFGGSDPVPGATITYSIDVTVTGAGTATGVVISDPIPADTTYVSSSMMLGGGPLTDAVDGLDGADFGITTLNTITVDMGDLTAGTQTITFEVTIN